MSLNSSFSVYRSPCLPTPRTEGSESRSKRSSPNEEPIDSLADKENSKNNTFSIQRTIVKTQPVANILKEKSPCKRKPEDVPIAIASDACLSETKRKKNSHSFFSTSPTNETSNLTIRFSCEDAKQQFQSSQCCIASEETCNTFPIFPLPLSTVTTKPSTATFLTNASRFSSFSLLAEEHEWDQLDDLVEESSEHSNEDIKLYIPSPVTPAGDATWESSWNGRFLFDPASEEERGLRYCEQWMKAREHFYLPNFNYWKWQRFITPKMRAILLDWMMSVAEELRLHRETVHSAINYIDRFLSVVPNMAFIRFQLLGSTALHIASKLEDRDTLSLNKLILLCDNAFSLELFLVMERLLIQKLEWYLLPPTCYNWLKLYFLKFLKRECLISSENLYFPKENFSIMMQQIDWFLLDASSLRFTPSMISASVFYMHYCGEGKLIEQITNYTQSDLSDCINHMEKYQCIVEETKHRQPPSQMLPYDFHEYQYRAFNAFSIVKKKLKRETWNGEAMQIPKQ